MALQVLVNYSQNFYYYFEVVIIIIIIIIIITNFTIIVKDFTCSNQVSQRYLHLNSIEYVLKKSFFFKLMEDQKSKLNFFKFMVIRLN